MKIAIISDIHNNLVNFKKVLDYCGLNDVKKIICCGDLASLEMLDFLNDNFGGEIFYVFGNMDNDFLRKHPFENETYKKTKIFRNFGEAKIGESRIAFTHFPEVARKLGATGKYDFVFYGHTHKPWEENVRDCKMLNPGNVAGEIYPATFAVWETENNKVELVKINQLIYD